VLQVAQDKLAVVVVPRGIDRAAVGHALGVAMPCRHRDQGLAAEGVRLCDDLLRVLLSPQPDVQRLGRPHLFGPDQLLQRVPNHGSHAAQQRRKEVILAVTAPKLSKGVAPETQEPPALRQQHRVGTTARGGHSVCRARARLYTDRRGARARLCACLCFPAGLMHCHGMTFFIFY